MNNRSAFSIGMIVAPLALLTLGVAFASSVTTPNTFVAGTTAVAAEVNQNFSAHAAAINDNNSRLDSLDGFAADVVTGQLAGSVLAAVAVDSGGNVLRSFVLDPSISAPVVSGAVSLGQYDVQFPGATGLNTRFVTVSRMTTQGFIRAQSSPLALGDTVQVRAQNTSGTNAPAAFILIVH